MSQNLCFFKEMADNLNNSLNFNCTKHKMSLLDLKYSEACLPSTYDILVYNFSFAALIIDCVFQRKFRLSSKYKEIFKVQGNGLNTRASQ